MFGIGTQELLVVGVLCLLVFGPERLTNMARDAGRFVRRARRSIADFESEMEFDGGFEGLEDFEEDEDGAERSAREGESPEVPAPGSGTGNHERQNVPPGRGRDEELEEVPIKSRLERRGRRR